MRATSRSEPGLPGLLIRGRTFRLSIIVSDHIFPRTLHNLDERVFPSVALWWARGSPLKVCRGTKIKGNVVDDGIHPCKDVAKFHDVRCGIWEERPKELEGVRG